MPAKKGFGYLTWLPEVDMCCGFFSLRLGSLLISIYSIIHALLAGYNEEFLKRRELELNLTAAFCAGLVIVSGMLMIGVFMEKQGVCLLWLWYNVIVVLPMLWLLYVIMKVHLQIEENIMAYRNMASIGMHCVMFYYIPVVHSYRLEIEGLDLDLF